MQKLLLPNRTEAPDNIADAKLLIIPAKNVDAYEILATDEQMSEMVPRVNYFKSKMHLF